jgi:hypothetical protein
MRVLKGSRTLASQIQSSNEVARLLAEGVRNVYPNKRIRFSGFSFKPNSVHVSERSYVIKMRVLVRKFRRPEKAEPGKRRITRPGDSAFAR